MEELGVNEEIETKIELMEVYNDLQQHEMTAQYPVQSPGGMDSCGGGCPVPCHPVTGYKISTSEKIDPDISCFILAACPELMRDGEQDEHDIGTVI